MVLTHKITTDHRIEQKPPFVTSPAGERRRERVRERYGSSSPKSIHPERYIERNIEIEIGDRTDATDATDIWVDEMRLLM